MNLLFQKLISSIIQIVVFSLIPFMWWLIVSSKTTNFFKWIGLKKIRYAKENKVFAWIVGISGIFLIISVFILRLLKNVNMATSEFTGLGIKALPFILIYGILNTSLPEEIFFRGFLLKRFENKLGFTIGNIFQAILFGLLHGVMFISVTGIVKAILIILFTGCIGWLMGFINEKKAEGSLLPSWCIHSIANIFSGICYAFILI